MHVTAQGLALKQGQADGLGFTLMARTRRDLFLATQLGHGVQYGFCEHVHKVVRAFDGIEGLLDFGYQHKLLLLLWATAERGSRGRGTWGWPWQGRLGDANIARACSPRTR